jgi:hypothetical protein
VLKDQRLGPLPAFHVLVDLLRPRFGTVHGQGQCQKSTAIAPATFGDWQAYLVEQTTAPLAASASEQETFVVPHRDFAHVQDKVSVPQGLGWQLAVPVRDVVVW